MTYKGLEIGDKNKFQLFEVGGAVRDKILGLNTKDIDFTAVLTEHKTSVEELIFGDPDPSVEETLDMLEEALVASGFEVFLKQPEFAVIRAHFPSDETSTFFSAELAKTTADFVLARKEGPYTDGRRPDWVKIGTLEDDLRRRDFTVNALATDVNGEIIDLFGGRADLEKKILKFVGDPVERLTEDALRAMRALRFAVTKDFKMEVNSAIALVDERTAEMLSLISEDRRKEEMSRMLKHDTVKTLSLLGKLPPHLIRAIFAGRMRLDATLKD